MEPSCSHCLCNIHVHTFRFSLHGCTLCSSDKDSSESLIFCICRAFGSYIKESMTDALLLPVLNWELDVRKLALRLVFLAQSSAPQMAFHVCF